jgi:hypothetical protein
MALVNVGGSDLPTPTSFDVGIQDISNAQRNAQGTMIIERIATKRTLTISYAYLDGATLSSILNLVSATYFNVTYLDPQTNGMRTGSFYCGDRALGMIDYQSGVPRYQNLKFELIER